MRAARARLCFVATCFVATCLVATCLVATGCAPEMATDAGPTLQSDAGPEIEPDAGTIVCADLPSDVAEGRTGSDVDTLAAPRRSVVLMGGSAEVDTAAQTFVEAAGGGDVLVLRASGSTESYLPYFESELGADPAPASVAVLRSDVSSAAGEEVACRVDAAEAVWLAGGDQWEYLGGWQSSVHEALAATAERGAAIGGTSAGAMSLSAFSFDARDGSVSSNEALTDPTSSLVAVSASPFAQPELAGFLVDTHFSERDREGRMLAFLAHARALSSASVVYGIGLDEQAALVIENGGFGVRTAADRSVWVYRFDGEVDLTAGARLTMTGIARIELTNGDEGGWPPAWTDYTSVELVVTDGVASVR